LDQEAIDRILAVWQPRTTRVLSDEDARQIAENLTGFFQTLLDWVAEEKAIGRKMPGERPGANADVASPPGK
jgi:hypothetical protein